MDIPESTQRSTFEKLQIDAKNELDARYKRGANWFYWIAALSMATSVAHWLGLSQGFLIGLTATQLVDGVALVLERDLGLSASSIITYVALAVDLAIAATFALFGYLSRKGSRAAYTAGMALYLLDGALALFFFDWLGVLFHGIALFFLWKGFGALRDQRAASQVPAA